MCYIILKKPFTIKLTKNNFYFFVKIKKMQCSSCNKYSIKQITCSACPLHFCSTSCMISHFLYSHPTPEKPSLLSPTPIKTLLLSPGHYQRSINKSSLITEGKIIAPITKPISQKEFSSFKQVDSSCFIGSGSYGDVYLSKNNNDNKFYAVKVLLKAKIIEKTGHLDNIYKEIKLHSKLEHKNIIKLISYYENENNIILIMEYAKKGTLFNYIRNRKYLSEKEAFSFFIQVANAIYFLHCNKLVHRDIKPENLLLTENNIVKLCDFGLCFENSIGNRNTVCGTLEYMAPEILDENSYNSSVDIWSLGVLLYEMLYGFTPFKNITRGGGRIVSFNNGSTNKISFETKDLIRLMLMTNPDKRINIKEVFQHRAVKKYESELNSNLHMVTELKDHIVKNNPLSQSSTYEKQNVTERVSSFVKNCFENEKGLNTPNINDKYRKKQNELHNKLLTLRTTLGVDKNEKSKIRGLITNRKRAAHQSLDITQTELMDAINLLETAKRLEKEQKKGLSIQKIQKINTVSNEKISLKNGKFKSFEMFNCDELEERETVLNG